MIFHIAVCSPDAGLRSGLERQCMEYYARRADACIVEQLASAEMLLQRDAAGVRYELYLMELGASASPAELAAAGELRRQELTVGNASFLQEYCADMMTRIHDPELRKAHFMEE